MESISFKVIDINMKVVDIRYAQGIEVLKILGSTKPYTPSINPITATTIPSTT